MLEDNQYNEIERYINNEMTKDEQVNFEQALKSSPKLAQTLAVYQDMSSQLEDIEGNLDFNHKLTQAAQVYQQSDKSVDQKSIFNHWGWIIIVVIFMSVFIWWKFYSSPTEKPLPSDIPIAGLWENTPMPSPIILRNNDSLSQEELKLQQAFILFEAQDYQTTLTKIDSIAENTMIYPTAQLLKGVCHFEIGNYTKAIDTYNNYLSFEDNPRDMALWYLALAQIKNKTLQNAKITLQEIIKEDYQQAEKAKALLLQIDL